MPKKPKPLKETPLKNPIGIPIGPEKKKPLKKSFKGSIEKSKETPIEIKQTPYERAVEVFGKVFINAEKKSGFELYKLLRDSVIDTISHSEDGIIFKEGTKHIPATCLNKMNILEKEYLENFFVSMIIKQGSPDMYPILIPIIDDHIKPKKQRQGASIFRECMAGFLVFLISGKSSGSIRQTTKISSQLFDLNNSYVEKSYKNIKNLELDKNEIIENDLSALLAMYGTIKYFESNFKNLSPIQKGNTRSENEFKKAIKSLEDLHELIINKNIASIRKFIKKLPNSNLAKFIEEINFDLSSPYPSVNNAFYTLSIMFFIKYMPTITSSETKIPIAK